MSKYSIKKYIKVFGYYFVKLKLLNENSNNTVDLKYTLN